MARTRGATGTNYLRVTDNAALDTTTGITIAAWVFYDGKAGTEQDFAKVCSKSPIGAAPWVSWSLGLDNAAAGSQKTEFAIDVGGVQRVLLSASALSVSAWVHLAATYDGANMRVYINGTQNNSVAQTGNIVADPAGAETQDLILGTHTPSNASNNLWNGRIAEFAMWKDVALSAPQVASLGNGAHPFRVRPGSLVYWPLWGRNSPEPGYVGGLTAAITGTFGQAEHPPKAQMLWLPTSRGVFVPAAAASGWGPLLSPGRNRLVQAA